MDLTWHTRWTEVFVCFSKTESSWEGNQYTFKSRSYFSKSGNSKAYQNDILLVVSLKITGKQFRQEILDS